MSADYSVGCRGGLPFCMANEMPGNSVGATDYGCSWRPKSCVNGEQSCITREVISDAVEKFLTRLVIMWSLLE